jgi:hypothetical protein
MWVVLVWSWVAAGSPAAVTSEPPAAARVSAA